MSRSQGCEEMERGCVERVVELGDVRRVSERGGGEKRGRWGDGSKEGVRWNVRRGRIGESRCEEVVGGYEGGGEVM